jgi:hypothetical protein
MANTIDYDKLRAACDVQRFMAFEREAEGGVQREVEERRRKVEEQKRAKEKRARKKRLKTQAQAQA